MSTTAGDRRQHARAPVSLVGSVEKSGEAPQPVTVLSLSASGALIHAHVAPDQDALYRLQFNVHRRQYDLPFRAVGWLRQGEAYGWRCHFAPLVQADVAAIAQAVDAALGKASSEVRAWADIEAEAGVQPDAKISIGRTPAGHDIEVLGRDAMEMHPDGVELYVRLISELETM